MLNIYSLKKFDFQFIKYTRIKFGILFTIASLIFFSYPLLQFCDTLFRQILLSDFFLNYHTFFLNNHDAYFENLEKILQVDGLWGIALSFLQIVVVPSITEEFFFRGGIQNLLALRMSNRHFPVLLTAFIFSIIHFQFLAFFPRFLLGIMFGYIFYFTKNIWYPICAHLINNTMGFIVLVFFSNLGLNSSKNMETIYFPFWMYLLSLGICFLCFKNIWREQKKSLT